ncbi:MAG: hypothetical protein V9G98_18885 [Candidatus Competibacter sp.]
MSVSMHLGLLSLPVAWQPTFKPPTVLQMTLVTPVSCRSNTTIPGIHYARVAARARCVRCTSRTCRADTRTRIAIVAIHPTNQTRPARTPRYDATASGARGQTEAAQTSHAASNDNQSHRPCLNGSSGTPATGSHGSRIARTEHPKLA